VTPTHHDITISETNERADIQLPDSLVQGIAELSDIERGVITGRYGLDSEHRSLNSLAEEFAVTKQAIRSAEQRALKRLRRVSS
jgi:DNA-directed RNA polymerase sigma subunit (sigma70/sigma32)